MGRRHLTRLEEGGGTILPSYRPVCRCGWSGAEFWSRGLAEHAGLAHQLAGSGRAAAIPVPLVTEDRPRGGAARRSGLAG